MDSEGKICSAYHRLVPVYNLQQQLGWELAVVDYTPYLQTYPALPSHHADFYRSVREPTTLKINIINQTSLDERETPNFRLAY